MNDTELDELLNSWKTPEPSASFQERLLYNVRGIELAVQPRIEPQASQGQQVIAEILRGTLVACAHQRTPLE